MELLRMIILSLYKHKKRITLVLIQMIVGFSALIIAFNGIANVLQHKKDINTLANTSTIHPYVITESQNINVVKSIYNSIKADNRVKAVGIFESHEFPLNGSDFEEIVGMNNPIIYKNKDEEVWANLVMANNDLLKMINFKVKSGDVKELIEVHKNSDDVLPAIIGASLAANNPVGSIREIPYYKISEKDTTKVEVILKKIKIVGVLDSKMPFWSSGSTQISDSLLKDGKLIITPMINDSDNYLAYARNCLVQLNNANDNSNFIEFIKQIYTTNNLVGDAQELNSELNAYFDRTKVFIFSSFLFAILILTLSSFGLIGVTLSEIVRRKQEFGVRYAIGSTPKYLAYLICGEIFVVYMVSNFISIVMISLISSLLLKETPISFNVISILFAIVVTALFMILATIIPLYKIINTKPVDLINERRE